MPAPIFIPPKQRSLIFFFNLTVAISWAFWVPAALASQGRISFPLPSALSTLAGVSGPFVAAVITVTRYEGRLGLKQLFGRLLIWRVGIQWYLFALLWPVVFSLAKTGIAVWMGGAAPDFSQPPFASLYPLPPELSNVSPFLLLPFVFLQQTLIGSSMGEEIGWRGYALPRMQAQEGAFRASVLLGVIWAVWHLPLWLTKGHPMQGTFFGWTLLGLMATSVLFTWVYNNTQGSLLPALLFHSSIAITGLFLSSTAPPVLVDLALNWAMALLVIVVFGPKRLSRPEGIA